MVYNCCFYCDNFILYLLMKKINLAITGCMGRMGQQIIKSARSDKNFKIVTLTENKKIWNDDSKIFNIYLNSTDGDKSIEPFWTSIYYLDSLVYILIPAIVIILIFIFIK